MEWVKAFKQESPAEYETLIPFFSQYYYGTIIWSITRVLDGVDAKEWKEKLNLLKSYFNKEENDIYIRYLLEHYIVASRDKCNCQDILGNRYVFYALRNYYIPKCKQIIIQFLHRKLK